MAIKFDWNKYRSDHPKLPDVKEQWRRVIEAERGVTREAIHANKVEQARIKGQKEGLRIIGEEVAPFARYVIRNPKGDLVGIVNDQAQLEEQLKNLNITPNAFDPKGFNAQGKQEIGKYRIYDNAVRGEERKILEIAHPKAVPLHKRINVPLLINDRMEDAETETRASSVPIGRDFTEEELEEEIRKMEEEPPKRTLRMSSGVKTVRTEKYEGKDIDFHAIRRDISVAKMPRGTEYTEMPGYPGFYITYDPDRKSGVYSVYKGLGNGEALLYNDKKGNPKRVYSNDLKGIIEKGKKVIESKK